jgi:PhnB protein
LPQRAGFACTLQVRGDPGASARGAAGLPIALCSSLAAALSAGLTGPGTSGCAVTLTVMTGIQPELWIDRAAAAVAFYEAAFGARVLHQVGEGDEIVAQLAIGDAAFWVSSGGADGPRFSPGAIGGATGRTLLLVDDPDATFARAVEAGATAASEMADEHGWRVGRIFDPFGHEWEIGRPLGHWPPA